jgi:hypothetical protein
VSEPYSAGRNHFPVTKTTLALSIYLFATLGLAWACGSSGGTTCKTGVENCRCYDNATCNDGLECLSNVCVEAATGNSGGASGGGSSGQGGESAGGVTNGTAGQAGAGGGAPFVGECAPPLTRCGEECVNLNEHPLHCAQCDNACAGGVCVNGGCVANTDCTLQPCQGFSYCDPSDKLCKPGCAMNAQCGANEECNLTSHACLCSEGFHDCADICVPNDSAAACGPGCIACPQPAQGTAACQNNTCSFVCGQGFVPCGNGCVQDALRCNPATCDVCATSDPNAVASCNGTTCVIECLYEFVDCDGECLIATGNDCYGDDSECCEAHGDFCDSALHCVPFRECTITYDGQGDPVSDTCLGDRICDPMYGDDNTIGMCTPPCVTQSDCPTSAADYYQLMACSANGVCEYDCSGQNQCPQYLECNAYEVCGIP